MNWRTAFLAAVLAASAPLVHANCLTVLDDAPETIAEFRDNGVSIKSAKKVMTDSYWSDSEKPYALAMVDSIYASKVKPWSAKKSVESICKGTVPPSRSASVAPPSSKCPYGEHTLGDGSYQCLRSPQEIAADEAKAEKQREINYRESKNRMPSIPGICVGDECSQIRKIQHWDADGQMTN
ncbi:hypothetical protein AB4Y32_16170 [Paraburkholderia phymatum]|uniref:Uncharacterized protein n=1 Tax=Paraburkholderia phymatum TaxID=148447 RepID=A0ACC6U0Z7_9BURK